MSSPLRITGLATGLDVDTMVKQLMSVERMKVDKLLQNRQVVQWKQEMFRDIIGDLNTFKSSFFDVLKPDNYMLSSKNYSSFDVANNSNDVTITTSSGAVAGDYKVKIANIAEKAKIEGNSTVNVKEAAGSINFPMKINSENKNFIIDGQTVTLTEKVYNNLSELASELNSKMANVPASGPKLSESVSAVVKDNTIRFDRKITIGDTNNVITVAVDNGSGTIEEYKVTVDKGNYTIDQLNSTINGKLSGVKSVSGNATFPTGYKLTSNDGVNISIINSSNIVAAGSSVKYDSTGTVVSSGDAPTFSVATPTAGAATKFNGATTNILSLHREILAGVNDKLYVKVGTATKEVNLANLFKANDGSIDNIDSMTDSQFVDYLLDSSRDNNINNILQSSGISTIAVSKSISGKLLISSSDNQQVSINGNGGSMLGLGSSFNLDLSINDKMANLINVAQPDGTFKGEVKFTVNNVTFRYDFSKETNTADGLETIVGAKNKSISEIMSDISTKANVDFSYSQLTRKFTMQSKTTGSDQIIINTGDDAVTGQTSKFLETLLGNDKISSSDGSLYDASDALTTNKLQGKDSLVYIKEPNSDYIAVTKPTNSFTIDGVNYVLNNAQSSSIPAGYDPNNDPTNIIPEIGVKLTGNTQKTFDKIKAFVDKYNDIIEKINTKLFEKKQYDYKPLTDEQKKEMKEDEIKQWEEKAKQGLLGNDSTLGNMLTSMRSAFYEPVRYNYSDTSSIGLSMSDIGITTSSDMSQRGKLVIDEAKLKDALQNKGDKVVELFTKTSSTVASYNPNATTTERQQRYKESGVFQRINDILQDNLRTFRDSNGKKGILLEKAGIRGDISEFRNLLTEDINRRDKIIKDMNSKLAGKENNYYIKFSKLESAMQKLNEQSNWLSSQLGGMSK